MELDRATMQDIESLVEAVLKILDLIEEKQRLIDLVNQKCKGEVDLLC